MKKLFISLLSLFLILCASYPISASGGGMLTPALDIIASDVTMVKSALRGNDITFGKNAFDVSLGCKTDYITVTALPPESDGVLYYGSTPVKVNQMIGSASFSELRFSPSAGCQTSSFRFKSGGEYSIACELKFTDEVNFAPVITSSEDALAVWTQTDISSFGKLSGSDPEGDDVVFEVVKYPEKGILTITNPSSGEYIYTPCDGMRGSDSFTYTVRDSFGNYSAEAVVPIEIDKRRCAAELSDMEGHWAHNAAVVMVAENAMDVRSVGGELFFDPDEEISREDFIVTVMKALGAKVEDVDCTPFADDDMISASAKGYVKRALDLGVIKGSEEDGLLCFRPQDSITRAESAVVLNSIIGAEEPDTVPVFADSNAVPTWAQTAMYALSDAGIFKGNGGGYISPNSVLSRGETAQILLTVLRKYTK